MNPKEYAANMLAEVKLQERKLAKLEETKGGVENAIRAALRANDRERAEKLALQLQQVKAEIAQKQGFVKDARVQFEQAKQKSKQLEAGMKSAKQLDATLKAMEGINKSMDTLGGAEDMLRQIEEQVAVSEAKFEIAMDDAEVHARKAGVDRAPEVSAEALLAEFEAADKPGAAKPADAKPDDGLDPGGQPPAGKTIG